MAKSNKYTWIAFVFLSLMGIFAMWMIGKSQNCEGDGCTGYKYMGWFALAFCIGICVYLVMRDRAKPKIPFDKVKQAYITAMEEKNCITINPLAEDYQMTEEGNNYVFVLRDYVDDIAHYYMCEADMYEGHFGRGFGQRTTKETEAVYWYQTRKKTDVGKIMSDELRKQNVRELVLKKQQQEAQLQAGSDFK